MGTFQGGFPALAIQQPNIGAQLETAMNIKARQQQIAGQAQAQELGAVQLQQAKIDAQSRSTLMRLWSENSGDMNATIEAAKASNQVTPEHLQAFQLGSINVQTAAAKLTADQLTNQKGIYDLAANKLDAVKRLPLMQRPQAIMDAYGELLKAGGNPTDLEPHIRQLVTNPSDDAISTYETSIKGGQWAADQQLKELELASKPTAAQAQARTTAELTSAQNAATKSVVELTALPQQLQDAHKKNVAEVAQATAATALQTEQLHQLRQSESYIRNPDPTGFTTPLPVGEYNKRYDSFTNGDVYKQVKSVQGSYQQFGTILNDLDSNKPLTGAASVVALFDAVGISATPLAGKGFRINSNVIGEHVGARGLDQSVLQKVLSLKQGDIITPGQVRDYANIAANVYKQTYINAADEAHREGLPADFLPRGGGKMIDSTTAKIYANVVAHERPDLASNPGKLQQAAMKAARDNGWKVDDSGISVTPGPTP